MLSMKLSELHERKIKICNELSVIKTMRRGTLNEYYHTSTLKDGTVKKRGPFYNIIYSGEKGKTISKSVAKKDVEQIKHETLTFQKLSNNVH